MRLESLTLIRVAMPLVRPFTTSFGSQSAREVLLACADIGGIQGWGECVAMSEPVYNAEYVDGVEQVLVHHLVPRLMAVDDFAIEDVGTILRPILGHHMAKATIETALLDAWLRSQGQSLANYLGATKDRVLCGVSVGIAPTTQALLEEVDGYRQEGYRRIKLKIQPGWDVEPVRLVRALIGPDLPLTVDANRAYDRQNMRTLTALDEYNLQMIEQPLPEDDIAGHVQLAQLLTTPLCLDESICSTLDAVDAIERGACRIVNIKPGRVGGYLESTRIHDACAQRSIPVWCGGMLETGIGRAANLALAALPNFTLPNDTSASARYYRRDLTEPFVLQDGSIAVPQGPGIGVAIDLDMLQDSMTARRHIERGALTTPNGR